MYSIGLKIPFLLSANDKNQILFITMVNKILPTNIFLFGKDWFVDHMNFKDVLKYFSKDFAKNSHKKFITMKF